MLIYIKKQWRKHNKISIQFSNIIFWLQDASTSGKMNDKSGSGSSEITEKLRDVQIQSENEGETEGATGRAVHLATNLEELERGNTESLDVKELLEKMSKKQEEEIIALQQKILQAKEINAKYKNEMHDKLKSDEDGMNDLLEIVTEKQEEEIEFLNPRKPYATPVTRNLNRPCCIAHSPI